MSGTPLRPVKVVDDIVEITLVDGRIAICDIEDIEIVNKSNWCAKDKRLNGLIVSRPERTKTIIYLHRMIARCPRGMYVDHLDGNFLNNRRDNLRIVKATRLQLKKWADMECKSGVGKKTPSNVWVPQYVIE